MAVAIDSANKYRQRIGELLTAYKELLSIDAEYTALDIGNSVTDTDFSDITAQEFRDGVTAARNVMAAIVANQTALYRVSDGSQR